MMGHKTRLGLVAGAVLFASGCYSYRPVDRSIAPIGREVRVYLTAEEMTALRREDDDGLSDALPPRVIGTLVSRDNALVSLRIPIASHQVGFLRGTIDRQLDVPTGSIVGIETRAFSPAKTALAIGAGGVAIAAVAYAILGDALSPSSGGGNDDNTLGLWAHPFFLVLPNAPTRRTSGPAGR